MPFIAPVLIIVLSCFLSSKACSRSTQPSQNLVPTTEQLILSGWKWVDEQHPLTAKLYPLNQNQSICLHLDQATGQSYPGVLEFTGRPYKSPPVCQFLDGEKSYSTRSFWALGASLFYYLLPQWQHTGLVHSQLGISDPMRNICMIEDTLSDTFQVGFKSDDISGCIVEGGLYPDFVHFHHQGFSALNQALNYSVWAAVTITTVVAFTISVVILVCIVPDELWGSGAIRRAREATTIQGL
ncbi:MAG: hypothetical protein ACR2PX_07760 [Endozoicomonas sp.]|uniref:hypothetical protein n=1 Tax=Endozoicomonas sp. TaxID=1892382 RepID=UPI003D9AE4C1